MKITLFCGLPQLEHGDIQKRTQLKRAINSIFKC